jgi:hypothetical protein
MENKKLRGRWHDIIILNVFTSTWNRRYDKKDSFYKKLDRVLEQFPKYHMRIFPGDFCAKVGRENILNPKIRNENLHEIGNDSGVRVINIIRSKNPNFKSTTFPHRNIPTYNWTSDVKRKRLITS